jgi:archaellum component FlaF (FlaF/FlaG flagellin family)
VGFSLVAAFSVIGVTALISIEIFTGAILPTLTDFDDSYDEMIERKIDRIQTMINITNVSNSVNGSNYDHNITVKNKGSVTLKTIDFTILINGTKQQFISSKLYLYPEQNSYFNIYNISGSGTKILKVITNNGISDYYQYTI